MKCLFYVKDLSTPKYDIPALPEGYEFEFWRPRFNKMKPAELPWMPFGVWWLFHIFHLFANRRYALFLIRREGRLVHRSCIFPGFFRFPFMAFADLQVGDTWTAEEDRNKGLAEFALRKIVHDYAQNSRVWYLAEEGNEASIRVPRKCEFQLYAEGERRKRYGFSILGSYFCNSATDAEKAMKLDAQLPCGRPETKIEG